MTVGDQEQDPATKVPPVHKGSRVAGAVRGIALTLLVTSIGLDFHGEDPVTVTATRVLAQLLHVVADRLQDRRRD